MEKAKTFAIWYLLLISTIFFVADYFHKKEIKELKNKIPETIFVERDVSPIPYDYLGEYTLTFYTHTGNRTKSGVYPKMERTIAVDPNVIPLGSILYVEGYGVFIAEDTGGKIKGNRLDIFVNTKQEAVNLGVKKAKVYKL